MLTVNNFIEARKQLLEIVNTFPKTQKDIIFFDNWGFKEIIAHICGWDLYFTQVLNDFKKNNPSEYWGNIAAFNQKEIEKRKKFSEKELMTELTEVSNKFIEAFQNIGNKNNLPIWKNKKYTPADLLKIEIHHYESQTKLLKKYFK